MQTQIHPSLCFTLEVFDVLLGLKELRPWGLNGQVHGPIAVINAIDQPHAAAGEHVLNLIKAEDHVPSLPDAGHVLWFIVVH